MRPGSTGGTEDFRNLVENPDGKKQSKMNALGSDKVQLAPLGYLPAQAAAHLKSPPGTAG